MRFTEFTVSDPSPGRVVPSRTKPCMNCSSPFLRSVSKKPSTNRPRGGSRADCNLRPLASQTPSGLPFCSAPSALLFLTLITRISGKGCEVWEAEETGVPTEVMDETKRSPSSDDFKGKVVSAQEPEGPPCHDRRPAGRHRPPDPQRGSWRTGHFENGRPSRSRPIIFSPKRPGWSSRTSSDQRAPRLTARNGMGIESPHPSGPALRTAPCGAKKNRPPDGGRFSYRASRTEPATSSEPLT
jgi:hypothetical protein